LNTKEILENVDRSSSITKEVFESIIRSKSILVRNTAIDYMKTITRKSNRSIVNGFDLKSWALDDFLLFVQETSKNKKKTLGYKLFFKPSKSYWIRLLAWAYDLNGDWLVKWCNEDDKALADAISLSGLYLYLQSFDRFDRT